jgi:serine/threonine protein kinase
MGAVYLAEDTRLGRQVALKMMRPELAAKPSAKDRFLA